MLLPAGVVLYLAAMTCMAQQPYRDERHASRVFGEHRAYRIFLPAGYAAEPERRFPVIYYFHGHSDRYTLEKYDGGLHTVPKIAAYTAAHPVIVVAADGYVAQHYTGFYGGAPYDVARGGGDYDYGAYFQELVRHIDATYRTIATRRYRATCGLSMGGFMSLYLSARYPDVVGSASAFNPGPEFYVGEKGRRSLWRPKDHTAAHARSMVRLIRASGDYISQYHEETRAAYARDARVDFEFRQDEYHRHWATSIAETFAFHERAFANPALDATPDEWNYASAYRDFEVRGTRVRSEIGGPGIVLIEHATQGGMRVRTRKWDPDGPPASASIQVTTAPLYRAGATYTVADHSLASGETRLASSKADVDGRLSFVVDGRGHEISFMGLGTGAQAPVLLDTATARVRPGVVVDLPLRVYNPRTTAQEVRAELTSAYPTVDIVRANAELAQLPATSSARARFQVRFAATCGEWQHARLNLKLTYDGYRERDELVDVAIAPDPLPPPAEMVVLDGASRAFLVFRQKGNQGGGASVERTVREGEGNGDSALEPGERGTVWVRLAQGLDPLDKHNWCRAKVYSASPYLTEVADIQEEKGREWTGAQNRSSVVELSPDAPAGAAVSAILDCESWSFQFTPDMRYGRELLYQAFQSHQHHLFAWDWTVGSRGSTR